MVITPKDTNDPGFLTGKSLQVDLVTTSEVEEANWFTRAMRELVHSLVVCGIVLLIQ